MNVKPYVMHYLRYLEDAVFGSVCLFEKAMALVTNKGNRFGFSCPILPYQLQTFQITSYLTSSSISRYHSYGKHI